MLSSSLEARREQRTSTTLLILSCCSSRWCPWAKEAMQLKAKQAFLQHPESLECSMSTSEFICLKKVLNKKVCYSLLEFLWSGASQYFNMSYCFLVLASSLFLYKNMFYLSRWICSYIYGALLTTFQPDVLNPVLFFYTGIYCIIV